MIQINKREAQYLASTGCEWGNYIHVTHSRYKKYFVTENPDILKRLQEFQKKEKQDA